MNTDLLPNQVNHLRSRGIDDRNIYFMIQNRYNLANVIYLLSSHSEVKLANIINTTIYNIICLPDITEHIFLLKLREHLFN